MSEYDAEYWKHGLNITAGQFCDYVKENIPSDAIFYICGNDHVNLHFSSKSNIFSADREDPSDLPEYEDCEAGEFDIGEAV